MELHSSVKAKQLWNFMRLAFFMMRNGLLSKRKFISLEMNLIMKRGKLLGKNLGNLITLHHHSKNKQLSPVSDIAHGFQEYEFSCENSPNPVFFHLNTKAIRSYFPCIGAATCEAEDQLRIECSPQCSYRTTRGALLNGDRRRTVLRSPYSVRISNYSMEDICYNGEISNEVDNQAEEFIRRFYEQLQAQSPALLQL